MTLVEHTPRAGGELEPTLQITHRSDALSMATFGPVCIAVWRAKPTRETFEVQRAHLAASALGNPRRQLFLCVVEASADPPDQDIRDASAKMIAGHGNNLAGCACVIEGSGFRAAITRTVLSGIGLLIRTGAPVTYFESVGLACAWLEKRGARGKLAGLAAELELARSGAQG